MSRSLALATGLAMLLLSLALVPSLRAAQTTANANPLQPFETRAAEALLIDAETGTVLFAKAPDDKMPPASLAKLMTVAVVFDAIKSGKLKMDDTFKVSENAWRKGGAPSGGSTMFAKLGSVIKVSDLLRGAIVQSANDGCIVLAEGIAGSEAMFANLMNMQAQRLGLQNSHFTNATGLPDAAQYVTARDLVTLARHLIYDFPQYYAIYRETSFTWNNIRQENRNPLLAMNIGADGLKTGFTDESGYGLVGSAVRDGQRLILVMNGAGSEKERGDEAKKLIDWGFRSFEKVKLFGPDGVVGEANVFGGDRPTVGLVAKGGVEALLPRGARDSVKGRVVYQGPVKAPITKGTQVGTVEVSVADTVVRQAPVYAANDVGVGSLTQRAYDGLRELLLGWWP
jgi:D-alanyl-D-alanine carboxypeptidase (penicillin-binding protein 5/6)